MASTSEERRQVRRSLMALGYMRLAASPIEDDGSYHEDWSRGGGSDDTVTLWWTGWPSPPADYERLLEEPSAGGCA